MTVYLYRILFRILPEHWPAHRDPAENTWSVLNNRSYNTLSTAKGVKTNDERHERTNYHWDNGIYVSDTKYEYRFQRYPLTQEWEDIDV